MIFGSLVSGIGGLDLGLEWAGLDCAWQVEIDPWCRDVLARHWPEVKRYEDVTQCSAQTLAPVDVLAGGFPCQDVSAAGHRAGLDGARSGLWFEFARLIRELRPRYVVVENVPGLRTRGLDRVLGDLAACGFDAEWESLPAAAVGAPHVRDRVAIVAYPDSLGHGTALPPVFPDLVRIHELVPVGRGANEAREVFAGPGATLWTSEPRLGRVADGPASRLDRRRLHGLGNAVVPYVAHLIGSWLVQAERRRLAMTEVA